MTTARDIATVNTTSWVRHSTLRFRRIFSLSENQASFKTRGFTGSDLSRQRALETIGKTFISGYNAALVSDHVGDLLRYVTGIPPALRGFAAEGGAMGTAIADALPFRRSRLSEYVRAFERDFTYLVHVGAGWALARLPWRRRQILAPLDPIHRWLAFDGLGFHDGYFFHTKILAGWRRERFGYSARCYDQGVGRALWFISGSSIANIQTTIQSLPMERHSDLWAGLGLAIAYAGQATADEIADARKRAGLNESCLALGVAFGCEARARAGHIPSHTEAAARAVTGRDADTLARLVRQARERLPESESGPPRYELWRCNVAAALSPTAER